MFYIYVTKCPPHLNNVLTRYLVKMKHHISYLCNALLEYYPLHQAEWQTRWHNPPDWGLVSSVATCLTLWSVTCNCNVCMRPEFMTSMSCDSVYCMCGAVADWWRSWPMANALACLRSCQWRKFWTYFVTINLFSLYFKNFMFHTMLDAACNIQRVHYKSMKCDVFIFTR